MLFRFELATDDSIFAIRLAALGQFIILAFVQAVDLVIKMLLRSLQGFWSLGSRAVKHYRRGEQEGPDYKGMLVHTSLPGTFIRHPGRESLQF